MSTLSEADHVLVVDDEAFSRQIVTRFLREMGTNLITLAKDGEEAVSALSGGTPFRMVISDFNMPNKSGLQLLQFIRSGSGTVPHDLPFLMLTGLSDREVVGAALALDVDCFVVKPISKSGLESRIAHVLSEPRSLSAAGAYKAIDVTTPFSALLSREPVAPAPPPEKRFASDPSKGRRVPLESVKPGAILSADIRGPGGELLLAKGSELSARLIKHLRELRSLKMPIEAVWVKI